MTVTPVHPHEVESLAEVEAGITEQIYAESPLLNIFASRDAATVKAGGKPKHIVVGSIENIRKAIVYDNGALNGWDALTDSPSVSITAAADTSMGRAVWEWAMCYALFRWDLDSDVHAGPDAINSILDDAQGTIVEDMKEQLATGLLSDGTSDQMAGLTAVTAVTGDYGGITKGTYTWWDGQADHCAKDGLDHAKFRSWATKCKVGYDGSTYSPGKKPTLCVTDYNTFDIMAEWGWDKQVLNDTNEFVKLGLGEDHMIIDGVYVFPDTHMDVLAATNSHSGELFMLNPDYFQFYVHERYNFAFKQLKDNGLDTESANLVPIDLPTVLFLKYLKMITVCQLICKRPRNTGHFYRAAT